MRLMMRSERHVSTFPRRRPTQLREAFPRKRFVKQRTSRLCRNARNSDGIQPVARYAAIEDVDAEGADA
jgi:hypothetical protein